MASQTKRPGLARPSSLAPDVKAAVEPLNDVLNRVTGVTLGKVLPLKATATNAQIISKINELLARLQED